MEYISFIMENVSDAFSYMSQFEILPGFSLLTFFIILFVLDILFDIFWIGAKSYMRGEANSEAWHKVDEKYREHRKNSRGH